MWASNCCCKFITSAAPQEVTEPGKLTETVEQARMEKKLKCLLAFWTVTRLLNVYSIKMRFDHLS